MGEAQSPLGKFLPLKINEVLEDGSDVTTTHYHVLCGCVPDEFKNYAEKVLNETPENVTKGMQRLTQLLEKEKKAELSADTLRIILRNSKYDLKKAETKLMSYLKTRDKIIERLAQMEMKTVETLLEKQLFGVLPYRDKDGRAILFHSMNVDTSHFNVLDATFLFFAFLLYLLEFPMTSLTGIVQLAEWRLPPPAVLFEIFKSMRMFTKLWLSLPIRVRAVEGVNESAPIRWILNIMRPVMPTKIFSRVVFYGEDLKKLHASYHPDILPEEFGGTMGPISTAFYREDFIGFLKRLATEHRTKTNAETVA